MDTTFKRAKSFINKLILIIFTFTCYILRNIIKFWKNTIIKKWEEKRLILKESRMIESEELLSKRDELVF